ncbi:alpha-L-rhamnosidase [Streptomyces sp. DvalAA-14]|uniref:alpha-L-rhamnosidase-related protein n=1 Tax=unclassified Streptomyces TaxID=2593676 RepID=UPI00081B2699|nr:alpha-L-rhamnosidase [Streptomyces sp. DvalAA-14]SCE21409.1 alpha-L-rhamnosidase [Streptomyces sp. DvalAA-14]
MEVPHLPEHRSSSARSSSARSYRAWIVFLIAAAWAAVGLPSSTAASPAPAGSRAVAAVAAAAPAGRSAGDAYIYAPSSRTLPPVAVHSTSGSVGSPQNVLSGASTRISGANSALVLDFGKEVGGLVTLKFAGASGSGQQVGLAFSESSLYTGPISDLSAGTVYSGSGTDGALHTTVNGAGTYTMPTDKLRGGFRYLTVFLSSSGWVDLDGVSLAFTGAAGMSDPSAYRNYFYSSDPLLNKIWYAGAYTVQMDTIDPGTGRAYPPPASGWENNAVIGSGAGILSDGAKRDRAVWPGDLGVSLPTEYASTDDIASTKNALNSLYQHQNSSTGELEYGGPAVNFYGSDTYHTWTLIGTASYYTYSADKAWLDSVWTRYKLGMAFITAKIDGTGLLNVTGTADWARGGQGGENIEANALLYAALTGGAALARAEGDTADATGWQQRAAAVKSAANQRLWNSTIGLYRDNPTSTLYPQDGNSLAAWYGLTDSPAKNTAIARALAARWNNVGAASPEKDGGAIGTFPGSMEVQAHFVADDDINALTLVRREWGYMLNSPTGTGSTFWEGLRSDGSFDYGGTYMSLAHGWATGPTSALTFYLLGLAPTGTSQFDFVPHPGDLTHTEGTISLPQGTVTGDWDYDAAAGTLTEQLTSPAGSTGRIGVPTYGSADVSVSVNGSPVWSGGAFHAAAGVTGGSTDGSYVYLTGVAAGSYTVSATGLSAPAAFSTSVTGSALPAGYTLCAAEGGTCTPSGTQVMAYGAGGYAYRTATGATSCSSASFGGADPAYGVLKSCYLAPAGGPSGYTACAAEHGTCAVGGTREVAYGAGGAFRFQVVTGSVACTNDAFGTDPLSNVAKSCWVAPSGPPPGNWTACAAEHGTCAVTGAQPIAFGADGAFWIGRSSGSTSCDVDTMGIDPVYNVAKSCYAWAGPPAGYPVTCSAENGTCALNGRRTVAYGADGDYLYATFTGSAPCTSAAFGSDPLAGVAKSCYVTS